ncbi:MAG: trans-2-enoyl-CoA reductase family protein [Spirochaetales bacterium]|nr:trans-2-enoyl-CoA reductase family protein [Spirochaetales bacterium]
MIIQPKIRNNICMNAHPEGCRQEVLRQINFARKHTQSNGPKNVLVIGASTGYGLASRISAAFGYGAATVGVSFEKEASESRPGTPGWYNTRAFDTAAVSEGLVSYSLNGDAFSHEIKNATCSLIKKKMGKIDLVVYSLASGVRPDPDTGELYRSVLKPIGRNYTAKSVDFISSEVSSVTFTPATAEETMQTVKVMGGEDWILWIKALMNAEVLDENVLTIAYSYIGPRITYPIYREGTIGKAKEHLEKTAFELTSLLEKIGGRAYVSVNKALVTRASAVIPVVPLYISLLFKIMKKHGLHEGCIDQTTRLFSDFLYSGGTIKTDKKNRIRIDDLEMKDEIQEEIELIWNKLDGTNIMEYCDLDGYRNDFLKLHGFAVDSVDYNADISPLL